MTNTLKNNPKSLFNLHMNHYYLMYIYINFGPSYISLLVVILLLSINTPTYNPPLENYIHLEKLKYV